MFFLRGTFLFLLLLFSQSSLAYNHSQNAENQRVFEYIRDTLIEYKENGSKPPADQLEELKKAKETVELTDEQVEEIDKLIADLEGKKQEAAEGKTPTELMKALNEISLSKPNFFNSVAESTLNGFNAGASAGAKLGAPVLGAAAGAAAGCINGICSALSAPRPSHSSSTNTAPPVPEKPSIESTPLESSPVETSPPQRTPAQTIPSGTNRSEESSASPESAGVDTTTGKPEVPKSSAPASPAGSPRKTTASPQLQPTPAHGSYKEEKETVFTGRPTTSPVDPAVSTSTSGSEPSQTLSSGTVVRARSNNLSQQRDPHPGNPAASTKESRLGPNVASFRANDQTSSPPLEEGILTSPGSNTSVPPSTPAGTYSWRKGGDSSSPTSAPLTENPSSTSSATSSFTITSSSDFSSASQSPSNTSRQKTGEKETKASYLDFSPLEGGNAADLEESFKEIIANQTPPVPAEVVAKKIQQVFDLSPEETAAVPLVISKEINRGIASDLSTLIDSTETGESDPNGPGQIPKLKLKQKPKVSPTKMTAGSSAPSKSLLDKVFSFFQI